MKVLLVEDHPATRLGVSSILEAYGIEVVGEAASAEESLYLARRLLPDLAILDLRLPEGECGVEICRELKTLPEPPRVLIYTAYNAEEDISSALLSGADGYLHKSLEAELIPEVAARVHAGERTWLLGPEQETARQRLQISAQQSLLTPREKEVFDLILQRYSNYEISEKLFITLPTTKTHVSNILKKLKRRSRRELFSVA